MFEGLQGSRVADITRCTCVTRMFRLKSVGVSCRKLNSKYNIPNIIV